MPDRAVSALLDRLPLEVGRRIDLLCDDFERDWQQDAPRPVEDYLASADAAWASILRDELIQVELECRFRRGHTPRGAEYQRRFPECAGALAGWLAQAEQAAHLFSTIQQLRVGHSTAEPAVGRPADTHDPRKTAPRLHRVLGEYELLERLGAGGVGEVYRAQHRRLGKLVAVKVLRGAQQESAEALARFRRETEAVGQLDHPHLVEAHDAGEQDGVIYLVLKLIDGVDLQRLVQESGPLPPAQACELIRQAALGVQHLHVRGLIHRDIKPSNLMRTPDGVVKVLDLGLARRCFAVDAGELTPPFTLMGTPDFVAPEQIDDAVGVDARADLYSLGATLFYLLTGRAPFAHHRDLFPKLKAHGEETPPDLGSLRPGVDEGLAGLVARLLAKQPGERPATAWELADALAAFTTPPPADATLAGPHANIRPPRKGPSAGRLPAGGKPLSRRGPVLALAGMAGLLLALLGSMAAMTGWKPDSKPQAGTAGSRASAAKPLKVLRLEVEHFARVGHFDRARGLLGRRSFTTHEGDGVTVTAELSAPAYCYLIAFRPDGTEEICFPEKEDEAPPLTERPGYPSVSVGLQYGLNEGVGLHAFVLVASAKPLPPYAEWRRAQGASPWRKSGAQAGVVWRLEGVMLRPHTAEDPEGTRGKGQEVRGVEGLPRVVNWLRQALNVEAVAAVAFAVQERQ